MVRHGLFQLGEPVVMVLAFYVENSGVRLGNEDDWILGERLFVHALCDLVLVVLTFEDAAWFG